MAALVGRRRVIGLSFPRPLDRPLRVLAIGCHSDDIEIGAGGTVLSLIAARPEIELTWVVLCGAGARGEEARASAVDFCAGLSRPATIATGEFRDGFLPYDGAGVKTFFEEQLKPVQPDVVITQQRNDLHQDHRLCAELTWNTFRDHLVLEYEVPKFDGDLGAPGVFVPLAPEVLERKVDLLMHHFASQRAKGWFSPDLFRALPRIRGMECQSPTGFAEAFYARKVPLDFDV